MKRNKFWGITVFTLSVCVILINFCIQSNKNKIEYVAPSMEFSLVSLDTFEDVCNWSDTIVKAKYVKRESFDGYSDIYIFKLEHDYIGNVDEKLLHVYEDCGTSFIQGKSYYLFLSSFRGSLYPHVVYRRTNTEFLMGDNEEINSAKYTFYQDYSLGLEKVSDISNYIETEIIAKNSYMVMEESVSFEQAYMDADAIYKIKVEKVSPVNPFVSICSYTVTEKLRELYSEEEMNKDKEPISEEVAIVAGIGEEILPNTIGPVEAKIGDQFILFMKYNENTHSYGMYSAEEFLYPIDSSEAQYVIRKIKE